MFSRLMISFQKNLFNLVLTLILVLWMLQSAARLFGSSISSRDLISVSGVRYLLLLYVPLSNVIYLMVAIIFG